MYLNRFVEAPLIHPTIMMRKEVYQRFGGYMEGPFPEDYEYWLRLMDAGLKFAKIDETLLDWYDSADRLSRTDLRYHSNAFYRIKTFYLAKWMNKRFNRLPSVWIWGIGKSVHGKSHWLNKFNISISGYIDIKDKSGRWFKGKPIIYYEDLPQGLMILSYVSDRVGRNKIHNYLLGLGYREGVNYYRMA
jgi:hypothetical protein